MPVDGPSTRTVFSQRVAHEKYSHYAPSREIVAVLEKSKEIQSHERNPGEQRTPAAIHSHELFGSRKELAILHEGNRYLLRITANNKLILTK
jgi:hemin uptake protein HemP